MPDPARRARGLVAALLAGGAAGAALAVAEVYCAQVLGTPLPPSLWAFLAAHYAPAGAFAALTADLLLPRTQTAAAAAERALAWMPPLVAAVYSVAVVNQNLLRGDAWGAAARVPASALAVALVAAAALAYERRERGRATPSLSRCAARLLVFASYLALLHHALAFAERTPPVPAALLVPAAAAAATAALALGATAVFARVRAAAPALCAAGTAAVLVSGAGASSARAAARLRDAAQPAPSREGSWLAGKPNIVLVVLDTVRADHVSCYGYARRTTPHLDALAARGVRHANATTPAGWSLPAHASLFTGLFPRQHRVGLWVDERTPAVLDPGHVTLAEALAARGYATAGVSANPLLSAAFGLDQGFRYFHAGGPATVHARAHPLLRRVENWLPAPALRRRLHERFRPAFPSARDVTDEALAWLARPRSQPFFLFLNYMDAHPPRRARPGYSDRWGPAGGALPAWADRDDPGRPLTPVEQDTLVRFYDGALAYLDEQVGRLLAALDASADGHRTWVIVTADHGEALGEHGRLGHHCSVHEEVARVPLVERLPAGMGPAPGTVDEAPVQLTDIAPRVLFALGLEGAPPPRPEGAMIATAECSCGRAHPDLHGDVQDAIWRGGLKYVEESGRPPRLFDLGVDRGETRDVASERGEDAERLRAELGEWRAAVRPLAPAAAGAEGAREREEALRALGYIN